MTVPLPHEWGQDTREVIERQIVLRKALNSHYLPEPLKVSVTIASRPVAVQKIKALFGHLPRALVLQSSDSHVVCTLSGDHLTIPFSGSPGVVFHSMKKADDDGIAKRVALGIVLVAENFGALHQAAKMWRSLPNLSDAISDIEVAMRVVSRRFVLNACRGYDQLTIANW